MKRLRSSFVLFCAVAVALAALPAHATGVRVLSRGAPIQGTNGIAVGPDGLLYVTSVSGREIVVMNRNSGHIVDRIGRDQLVETPDDATFGPDGSLYWTALFAGQVGKRAPDGTTSIVATLPPGPNPIAFDQQGRLFVGLAAFGDGLYEVDPDGVAPPRLVLPPPTGGLNGFAFGPDGLLYSPQTTTGSVIRIDVDSGVVETFADGFTLPVALDFDSRGRLYVNDTAADEIVRIDLDSGAREVFAELSDGVDNLAFDAHDNLYVTSLLQGSVRKIRPNGRVRTISPAGMTTPGGVAVLPGGPHGRRDRVWVADFFSLRAFDGRSGRERAFVPVIPGLSALTAPGTVSAAGDRLVISSWILNSVQRYDPARDTVELSISDFATPLNAIDFGGDLIVAELETGSVIRADGDEPSVRTTLASGLAVPAGLAGDAASGDLYVTDAALGQVLQVLDGDGVLDPPTVVASGLASPEGLALLPGGDLLVVEAAAGRVSRIDPYTGLVRTVADGLGLGAAPPPSVPPTWLFNGIAVGRTGPHGRTAVYVTGDVANVVYKLRVD